MSNENQEAIKPKLMHKGILRPNSTALIIESTGENFTNNNDKEKKKEDSKEKKLKLNLDAAKFIPKNYKTNTASISNEKNPIYFYNLPNYQNSFINKNNNNMKMFNNTGYQNNNMNNNNTLYQNNNFSYNQYYYPNNQMNNYMNNMNNNMNNNIKNNNNNYNNNNNSNFNNQHNKKLDFNLKATAFFPKGHGNNVNSYIPNVKQQDPTLNLKPKNSSELSLNANAKEYIPKSKLNEIEIEKKKKEEEEKKKKEEEENKKIEEEKKKKEEEEKKRKEEEEKKKKEEEKKRKEEEEKKKKEEEKKKKKEEDEKKKKENKKKENKPIHNLDDLFNSNDNQNSEYIDININPISPNKNKVKDFDKIFKEKNKDLKKYENYLKEKEREKKEKDEKEKEKREMEERERRKKLEIQRKQEQEELERRNKTHIKDFYFIIHDYKEENEKEEEIIFNIEDIKKFKNWKICNETKLLPKRYIEHIENMKIIEYERQKTNPIKKNNYNMKKNFDKSYNKIDKKDNNNDTEFNRSEKAVSNDMEKWGRKDMTKEIAIAEKFMQDIENKRLQDPIKFDLTENLNILTNDNYDDIKKIIFNKIQDNVDNQEKFLDVLFMKAVNEKHYVRLYAKLCKDLDKELPQKKEKTDNKISPNKNAPPSSLMRNKLVDKCREIFKIDDNEKLNEYIKSKDKDEQNQKIKKFVLGNVNFIGELINVQLLSKKVVFNCIKNLFQRYEKNEEIDTKNYNLEAIIILTDKFGTLVKNSIIKEDVSLEYNSKINEIIEKLDNIQKNTTLPGYIKYKIINLIEKKKAGWEETLFEKNMIAKSKAQVLNEYESQKNLNSKINNEKGKMLNQEEINNKIEKDLKNWKEFIEDGENIKNYDWEIISNMYGEKAQCSLADILEGFVENCIDFASNEKNIEYANQYLNELISYYSESLSNTEINKIVEKVIELFSGIANLALDNNNIFDIWANIIIQLVTNKILNYEILDEISKKNDIIDEDYKGIFKTFKIIYKFNPKYKNLFETLKIVNDHKDLYEKIINE